MAVAASSSSKTSEDNSLVFSTVSEVTLGIFLCNSATCSSFSGMVFCCRQVLLVVFILQWHGVLLSAGTFVAGCGPQVGVGGREVTLGIFPCRCF